MESIHLPFYILEVASTFNGVVLGVIIYNSPWAWAMIGRSFQLLLSSMLAVLCTPQIRAESVKSEGSGTRVNSERSDGAVVVTDHSIVSWHMKRPSARKQKLEGVSARRVIAASTGHLY